MTYLYVLTTLIDDESQISPETVAVYEREADANEHAKTLVDARQVELDGRGRFKERDSQNAQGFRVRRQYVAFDDGLQPSDFVVEITQVPFGSTDALLED